MSYTLIDFIQYKVDGVATDASPTPTATLYNGDLTEGGAVDTMTVTKVKTGVYKASYVSATKYNAIIHWYTTDADVNQDEHGFWPQWLDDVADDIDALQGADSDTLETLSDQMDGIATWTSSSILGSLLGGKIQVVRGNRWVIPIEDLTLGSGKKQFTIKKNNSDLDSEALLFADDETGILVLNGSEDGFDAANIDLDYTGTTFTITVEPVETAKTPVLHNIYWGVQSFDGDGIPNEAYGGRIYILADMVNATE